MSIELTTAQKTYQRLYGLWFGALFAAIVGLAWTGTLIPYTGGLTRAMLIFVLPATGIAAVVRAFALCIKYPITNKQKLPYLRSWSFWAKFYGVIIAEFIVLFVLIRLLQAHHVQNGINPLIVFVIGLHFLPLAYWNGNKLWYATASVLCLAIAALVLGVSSGVTTDALGAQNSSVWALASAGIMVAVMFVTSFLSGLFYKRSIVANTSHS